MVIVRSGVALTARIKNKHRNEKRKWRNRGGGEVTVVEARLDILDLMRVGSVFRRASESVVRRASRNVFLGGGLGCVSFRFSKLRGSRFLPTSICDSSTELCKAIDCIILDYF
jgi:hypothetical protein